jgi:hypothetical protein
LIGEDPAAIQTRIEERRLGESGSVKLKEAVTVNLAQSARVSFRRLARPVEAG